MFMQPNSPAPQGGGEPRPQGRHKEIVRVAELHARRAAVEPVVHSDRTVRVAIQS
jgi:hypothetical protein